MLEKSAHKSTWQNILRHEHRAQGPTSETVQYEVVGHTESPPLEEFPLGMRSRPAPWVPFSTNLEYDIDQLAQPARLSRVALMPAKMKPLSKRKIRPGRDRWTHTASWEATSSPVNASGFTESATTAALETAEIAPDSTTTYIKDACRLARVVVKEAII